MKPSLTCPVLGGRRRRPRSRSRRSSCGARFGWLRSSWPTPGCPSSRSPPPAWTGRGKCPPGREPWFLYSCPGCWTLSGWPLCSPHWRTSACSITTLTIARQDWCQRWRKCPTSWSRKRLKLMVAMPPSSCQSRLLRSLNLQARNNSSK